MSVRSRILSCSSCSLSSNCLSPVPFSGPAPNPFIVIGEAPGEQEDREMQPFVGPSGRLLRRALNMAYGEPGFDECLTYINSVCCFPHGTPRQEHVIACSSNLHDQLEEVSPRFGLVLGGIALNALYPAARPPLSVSQYRGAWIEPRGSWGRLLALTTWHPSAVLRSGGLGSSKGQEWLSDLGLYVEAVNRFAI